MSAAMRLLLNIDLVSYLEYTSRGVWQRAPHLDILCEALHDVDAGKIRRLIVTMPPRHGKSEVISKGFPAWYLGRHPDDEVILVSYGAELAEDFSRINREKIREYGDEIFGIQLSQDSAAVGRWGIDGHRGGLIAAGVNGPLTGRGAKIAIIDDPVKSAAEANSATYRRHTLEWYQTVLRTRLAPGGAIILVQTRWHKNDLAGWLIESSVSGGEQWTVINMPAIAEENDPLGRSVGDALWPTRYPIEYLQSTRATMTPYQWSALYQQRPIDVVGALWNYDMISAWRLPSLSLQELYPRLSRIVVSIDPAVTSNENSDETGIIVAGIDADGHCYILQDISISTTPMRWAKQSVEAYWLHNADDIVVETNQGGDMISDLIRTVDKRPRIKQVRATRGKRIRAEPIASLYEQGRVHHVGTFPELEEQLCTWNPISSDSPDRLDALVWALTDLTAKQPAYQPPIVL